MSKNKYIDLTGSVFNRITVLSLSTLSSKKSRMWNCVCSCGTSFVTSTSSLTFANHKSCGCYASEQASIRMKINATTHGLSRTKAYRAWVDAKNRCYSVDHKEYCRYGAKGIAMHADLLQSVELWCHTLGDPPDGAKSRKWSVDRIDCTKNYEVGNIRWADAGMQARNQKKQLNNKSGVTGVTWVYSEQFKSTRVCCWWRDINNKSCGKGFSVKKYGLLQAFKLACEYRLARINELTAMGVVYSDGHGK